MTVECVLLTRFPSVLQSSRSCVEVWKVQEVRDRVRPFLRDSGQRTKKLRREGMRISEGKSLRHTAVLICGKLIELMS